MKERLATLGKVLADDQFEIMVTSYKTAMRKQISVKKTELPLSQAHMRTRRAFQKAAFEYLVMKEAHRSKNDNERINTMICAYEKCQGWTFPARNPR